MTIDQTAHQVALDAAEKDKAALLPTIQKRWYPNFHIAAAAGWINDPNGLVLHKGRYHAFFQHHPASASWGPMHWGHVTSEDLVTWKREPIALAPSLEADSGGVYSGSSIVGDDGRLYVFYTGNRWLNPCNRDEGNLQVQCLAVSDDGAHFEKRGVIIDNTGLPNFRDPKVFHEGDSWYMVLGATSLDNHGQVHLYSSRDLLNWNFDRVLYEAPAADVFMMECPDFFRLGDYWVLAYCPERPAPVGYHHRNTHNAGYVVGLWQPGADFEVLREYRQADQGHNFYAPQTFAAADGRRLGFGWMGSFTPPVPSSYEDGWAGQFTVPYELVLSNSLQVLRQPLKELERLRTAEWSWENMQLAAEENMLLAESLNSYEVELVLDLAESTAERIGLQVGLTEEGNHTYVGFDDLAQTVFLDRRQTGTGSRGYRAVPLEKAGELDLHLFVDRGSVEVFINQGEGVLSAVVCPPGGGRSLVLSGESGTTVVKSLKIWELGSIWADM